jgi:hypothetical protein
MFVELKERLAAADSRQQGKISVREHMISRQYRHQRRFVGVGHAI